MAQGKYPNIRGPVTRKAVIWRTKAWHVFENEVDGYILLRPMIKDRRKAVGEIIRLAGEVYWSLVASEIIRPVVKKLTKQK